MIEIFVAGERLDLPPDFQINLEVENPFMTVDHIPVAHTYSMDFPMSGKNKRLLGVVEGVLVLAGSEVPSEVRVNGTPLMEGKLCLDAVDNETRTISATFTNSMNWSPYQNKSLCDIAEFNEVNFRYNTPCTVYQLYSAKVFAILIKDILKVAIPQLDLDARYDGLLSYLAGAIMLYGDKDYRWQVEDAHGVVEESGLNDASEGLPNMPISDFVHNLCNLLCATFVVSGKSVKLISNNRILQSTEVVEWTVDDGFKMESVAPKRYRAGYENLLFENDMKWDGADVATKEVGSVNAVINTNQTESDCIYKVRFGAHYDYYLKSIINGQYVYAFKGTDGIQPQEQPEDDREVVDCKTSFVPVTPILSRIWSWGNNDLRYQTDLSSVFPSAGEDKPTKLYIGLLATNVSTSGSSKAYTTLLDRGQLPSGTTGIYHSLSMNQNAANNIFSSHHFTYKMFWETSRSLVTVRPILTATELSQLINNPCKKILIRNRQCLLNQASVTINADGSINVEASVVTLDS